MTDTLRDRLAAVLGPGNNDKVAYAQADAVLEICEAYAYERALQIAKHEKAVWQAGYAAGQRNVLDS